MGQAQQTLYAGAMLIQTEKDNVWFVQVCPFCGHVHTYLAGPVEDDPRGCLKSEKFKCASRDEYFMLKEVVEAKSNDTDRAKAKQSFCHQPQSNKVIIARDVDQSKVKSIVDDGAPLPNVEQPEGIYSDTLEKEVGPAHKIVGALEHRGGEHYFWGSILRNLNQAGFKVVRIDYDAK